MLSLVAGWAWHHVTMVAMRWGLGEIGWWGVGQLTRWQREHDLPLSTDNLLKPVRHGDATLHGRTFRRDLQEGVPGGWGLGRKGKGWLRRGMGGAREWEGHTPVSCTVFD